MTRAPLIQFVGALLLLLAVVGMNVFWYNTVTNESAQAASLAGQIQSKTNDSTRSAAAQTELSALSTDQASIQQYFVSTTDVVPFLEQLQKTGSFLGANVQIASVSATPGTPYGQLSLALSMSGSFNSLMRTLGSIEYGPYDTSINSLTLSSVGSSSSTPQWSASTLFSVGTETSSSSPVTASTVSATTTPTTVAPAVVATTTTATTTTAKTVPTGKAGPSPTP